MPVNGGATRIGLSETPWMCWSAGSAGKPAKSMNVGKRSTYSIAQSQRCDICRRGDAISMQIQSDVLWVRQLFYGFSISSQAYIRHTIYRIRKTNGIYIVCQWDYLYGTVWCLLRID